MEICHWKTGIRFILSFFFAVFGSICLAQHPMEQDPVVEKCAVGYLERLQQKKLGIYGGKEYFEHWLEGRKRTLENQPHRYRTQANGVRTIPVVVHVIHDGSPVGQGSNIPFSQIEAQIEILNQDYRRQNPDAVNTPDEFLGVAADANVEFVLAKQDPRGLPTNGVNRVAGSKSSYLVDDAALIGQLALWPPEDYMNIWVAPLQAPLLGYSSFPIAELPGLDFPVNTRETDGVTIDYRVFGQGGNAYSTSAGRTVTHEVGHYLGLRHIWGDGGCEVDDFVEDTPNQSQANNACLSSPRFTCDSRDMIENFMDYTPDRCMNLFTKGQVDRVDVVLNFSPRRNSLVNGRATREPNLAPNNLAVGAIVEPQDFVCSNNVSPKVSVVNVGRNRVNSARLSISVNGRVLQTRNFNTDLAPGMSTELTFNPIELPASGVSTFEVEILNVNGVADTQASDNRMQTSPRLQPGLSVPYLFKSRDFSNGWTLKNPDSAKTWEQVVVPVDGVPQEMIYLNGFGYEVPGELDYFISPQINLAETPRAQLVFKMAFSPYADDEFQESLLIAVSTDCGNSFDLLNPPYHKTGSSLATQDGTYDEFIPTAESQFRTELVNLGRYAGHGNIRIAFIAINGFGNNLFIKDIAIHPAEEFRYDFEIAEMLNPGPVVDGSQEFESIQINNTGNLPISKFIVNRTLGGTFMESFIADDETIPPGGSMAYRMPNSIVEGLNQVEYEIELPNYDQNGGNSDQLQRFFVQDDSTTIVPWRINFEDDEHQLWPSLNPEHNNNAWEMISTEDNRVITLPHGENGNSYWLASPLFDLSQTAQASVFFDWAARGFVANDMAAFSLQISFDGGNSYEEIWSRTNEQLNSGGEGDFQQEFVNLSAFTGQGYEKVRLAFKMMYQKDKLNPVSLDNIELFLSANPDPVDPGPGNLVLFPNPAQDLFNVTFNLPDLEDVNIQIVSSSGQVVHDVDYPNTLNQTYTFSTGLFSSGVYVLRITGAGFVETKRIIIQ